MTVETLPVQTPSKEQLIANRRLKVEQPELLPEGFVYASEFSDISMLVHPDQRDAFRESGQMFDEDPELQGPADFETPIGLAVEVEEKAGELVPVFDESGKPRFATVAPGMLTELDGKKAKKKAYRNGDYGSLAQQYHNGTLAFAGAFIGQDIPSVKGRQIIENEYVGNVAKGIIDHEVDYAQTTARRLADRTEAQIHGGEKFTPVTEGMKARAKLLLKKLGKTARVATVGVALASGFLNVAAGEPENHAADEAAELADGVGAEAGELVDDVLDPSKGEVTGTVGINPDFEKITGNESANLPSVEERITDLISNAEQRAAEIAANLETDLTQEELSKGLANLLKIMAPVAVASLALRKNRGEETQYDRSELQTGVVYQKKEVAPVVSRKRGLQALAGVGVVAQLALLSGVFHEQTDRAAEVATQQVTNVGAEAAQTERGQAKIAQLIDGVLEDVPEQARQGFVDALQEELGSEGAEKSAEALSRLVVDFAENPSAFEGVDPATIVAKLSEKGVSISEGEQGYKLDLTGLEAGSDASKIDDLLSGATKEAVKKAIESNTDVEILDAHNQRHVSESTRHEAAIVGSAVLLSLILLAATESRKETPPSTKVTLDKDGNLVGVQMSELPKYLVGSDPKIQV